MTVQDPLGQGGHSHLLCDRPRRMLAVYEVEKAGLNAMSSLILFSLVKDKLS